MNCLLASDGRTLWFRSNRSGVEQIYTSIDTSVIASTTRHSSFPSGGTIEGSLRILPAGNGRLSLTLPVAVTRVSNPVTIFDLLGRTVVQQFIPFVSQGGPPIGLLLLGDLPAGVYFISVQLRNQTLVAKYLALK